MSWPRPSPLHWCSSCATRRRSFQLTIRPATQVVVRAHSKKSSQGARRPLWGTWPTKGLPQCRGCTRTRASSPRVTGRGSFGAASGVRTRSFIATSAPLRSRHATASMRPAKAATCNGVRPSCACRNTSTPACTDERGRRCNESRRMLVKAPAGDERKTRKEGWALQGWHPPNRSRCSLCPSPTARQ